MQRHHFGSPVENDHLGICKQIAQNALHVVDIDLKSARIDNRDHLCDLKSCRKALLKHPGRIPHAVHFHKDTLRTVFLYTVVQEGCAELLLLIYRQR